MDYNKRCRALYKACVITLIVSFVGSLLYIPQAHADDVNLPSMPPPGMMVHLSPEFTPAVLKGIVIHPENAFKFDFIVYKGDKPFTDTQKKDEYTKLIKYFLASLAVPDEDQWVNLSPYEKNRIIKEDFGKTEMGRDLLAQDYLLKQITASLIYPQDKLGQQFWNEIYSRAYKQFGTSNIPVNTFNKVWIVPDEADIYEKGNIAYLYKSHLKVMLEEDYLSLQKHQLQTREYEKRGHVPDAEGGRYVSPFSRDTHTLGSQIVRQIILPQLEKEVNQDKNFAPLRQVFSGMILAAWYKRALRESLLAKIYANKAKVKGVEQDPKNNEAIYQRYLKAYKKGVFNYIKEDVDKYSNETIPRKYFSGGWAAPNWDGQNGVLHRHSQGDAQAAMTAGIVLKQDDAAETYDLAQTTVNPTQIIKRQPSVLNKPKTIWAVYFGKGNKVGREELIAELKKVSNDSSKKLRKIFEALSDFIETGSEEKLLNLNESLAEIHNPAPIWARAYSAISQFFQKGSKKSRSELIASLGILILHVDRRLRKAYFALQSFINSCPESTDAAMLTLEAMDEIRAIAEIMADKGPTFTDNVRFQALLRAYPAQVDLIWRAWLTELSDRVKNSERLFDILNEFSVGRFFVEILKREAQRGELDEEIGKMNVEKATGYFKEMVSALSEYRMPVWRQGHFVNGESLRTSLTRKLLLGQDLAMTLRRAKDSTLDSLGKAELKDYVLSHFKGKVLDRTVEDVISKSETISEIDQYLEELIFSLSNKNEEKKMLFVGVIRSRLILPMGSDSAMKTDEITPGGIDMNSANLNLQIKRDGNGVPLPVSQRDLENIHIDGLVPVILDIRSAASSPVLSQLTTPSPAGVSR